MGKRVSHCVTGLLAAWLVLLWGAGIPLAAEKKKEEGPKYTRNQQTALYQANVALTQENDPARTVAVLEEFLKKYPQEEHHLVHYVLGLAFHRQEKLDRAGKAYARALEMQPDHLPSCLNLAVVHYERKNPLEAARLWERAFPLSPKADPTLLYQAGAGYYEAKKYEDSARVLKKLLHLEGQPQKGWMELYIHVLMELGRNDEAIRELTGFLNRYPQEEGYWRLLAQLHLNAKKYRPAAAALEVAYRLKPPRDEAWKQLASIYFHLGSPLAGVKHLRRAYGPRPKAEQCDEMARWLEQAGRTDQALAELDRAIETEPTAQRHLTKARLLYDHGRYRESLESSALAVKLSPKFHQAHLLQGYAALELGRLDEAEKAFTQAAKSEKHKPQALAALHSIRQLKNQD